MDKYDEVADGHYIIAKQKGQVQIKICNNNGDPLIATLYNVLLAPDLHDGFFQLLRWWIHDKLVYFANAFALRT